MDPLLIRSGQTVANMVYFGTNIQLLLLCLAYINNAPQIPLANIYLKDTAVLEIQFPVLILYGKHAE